MSTPKTYIEIKAEVFKVIRANRDKPTKTIVKLIKEHLPNVSISTLCKCIKDLGDL